MTAFPKGDDANSYFTVLQDKCERGKPIECDSIIQLLHLQTNKRLHSHLITSPLSNQQEVSAFDIPDSGDNWQLGCKTKFWRREEPVSLSAFT